MPAVRTVSGGFVNVRTYLGPYPPSRPKTRKPYDGRTYIWSRCEDCGWLAEHLEESQAMQHTMLVADHRCAEALQLDLFGGTA